MHVSELARRRLGQGGTFAVMRGPLLLILSFLVPGLQAQESEHPFIESFTLTVQEGRVQVDWVMKGGTSCDGSEVERSLNGVDFVRVHRIEGICGDPGVPVAFTWVDESPVELSTLHYRIVFGSQGRSSVKSVRFDQLVASGQKFFPSPTTGPATLLLKVPASAKVDLLVVDATGRVMLRREGLVGARHELELSGFAAGTYSYVANADGLRFEGRFVRQ